MAAFDPFQTLEFPKIKRLTHPEVLGAHRQSNLIPSDRGRMISG
jgi:hypothetical protein